MQCCWNFFLLSLVCVLFANGKVYELYTRTHYHDILLDTPVGLRPSTVIAFYNATSPCAQALKSLDFDNHDFPGIEDVIFAKYEMTTEHERVWHEYEEHLDLASKLGIHQHIENNPTCSCPILAFVPATYANELGRWYLNEPSVEKVGIWDPNQVEDWRDWVWNQLKVNVTVLQPEPFDVQLTVSPHPGRLHFMSGSDNEDFLKERTFLVDGLQSHIEFEAFVGDEIWVSGETRISQHVVEESHSLKPTPDFIHDAISLWPASELNPTRDGVILSVKRQEDGHLGFDLGMRELMEPHLIRRRHSTTCMTHTRNLIIPTILPHIHPIGFKKIQMPRGFHARLKRFYQTYYDNAQVESWDNTGTQLNFAEVQTKMISLDNNFKERNSIANDVIKPILEEWSGKELEFTAFYGIREYYRDAVLRNHVDRVETHVVSAILQIGQVGVDEPWALEVYGFDGKRYQITLNPGEMALYEGHALVHGRPKPLNGTIFSNAFCHFKPVGWTWSASKVWHSDQGKDLLNKLHVRIQDIYR